MRLKRGLTLTARYKRATQPEGIINESTSTRFLKDGGDPMNERLVIGKGVMHAFDTEPARQIVGIVADSRDNALNRDPGPMMFIPQAQEADAVNALNVRISPIAWGVRTRGEPHRSSAAIQQEIRQ